MSNPSQLLTSGPNLPPTFDVGQCRVENFAKSANPNFPASQHDDDSRVITHWSNPPRITRLSCRCINPRRLTLIFYEKRSLKTDLHRGMLRLGNRCCEESLIFKASRTDLQTKQTISRARILLCFLSSSVYSILKDSISTNIVYTLYSQSPATRERKKKHLVNKF